MLFCLAGALWDGHWGVCAHRESHASVHSDGQRQHRQTVGGITPVLLRGNGRPWWCIRGALVRYAEPLRWDANTRHAPTAQMNDLGAVRSRLASSCRQCGRLARRSTHQQRGHLHRLTTVTLQPGSASSLRATTCKLHHSNTGEVATLTHMHTHTHTHTLSLSLSLSLSLARARPLSPVCAFAVRVWRAICGGWRGQDMYARGHVCGHRVSTWCV